MMRFAGAINSRPFENTRKLSGVGRHGPDSGYSRRLGPKGCPSQGTWEDLYLVTKLRFFGLPGRVIVPLPGNRGQLLRGQLLR
jgi:hypothetical protein